MNVGDEYINMKHFDSNMVMPRHDYESPFIMRTEVSPRLQFKCIKCSVLGIAMAALGAMDLALSLSKGNFWRQSQPQLNSSFLSEISDYIVFGSGIISFMSSALALRAAMVSEDSHLFTKIMVVSSVSTSILGLCISDYFS